MPPLLAGEIQETGLYDALNRVKDVEITCGVLRIACNDFIGLMGIESANRIVGAVTKDGQAGRLTDSSAVTKILGLTAGTFEYYEVPEKELSRLNQNLGMDITELLSSYASNGEGEADVNGNALSESPADEQVDAAETQVSEGAPEPEPVEPEPVEPEHVEPEQLEQAEPEQEAEPEPKPEQIEPEQAEGEQQPIEAQQLGAEAEHFEPEPVEAPKEPTAEEPATVQTEKVSTLLAKFKKEAKSPEAETGKFILPASGAFDKNVLDKIGTKGFDASTLDAIGSKGSDPGTSDAVAAKGFDASTLDAIGTKGFDASTLDAIGTKGFDASTLDAIGTKGFDASTLDAIGTKGFDASTLDAIGTKSEPFDPTTDAVNINAAATVERIKNMRKPDAELEAEAAKAQRMKFASRKNTEPPPTETAQAPTVETDASRSKSMRLSDAHVVPIAKVPRPAVKISPKVYMAAGGVLGLVVLFFIVRVPIGNYLVTSSEGLFNKRDFKGALDTLNPVFLFDPSNTQAHFLKGKILSAQGEQAKAFEEYDTALKANPLDGDLLRAHALLAWKMNKNAVLKADTDTLIMNDQRAKVDGFFYGLRAKAQLDLGNPKAAYEDCTQALKLGQKTPWIYARRGWALVNKGDPKSAIKDFNTAISFPKNDATADAYVGKGAALVAMKDNNGALACYNAALKINDKSAATYATRAYLYSNMNMQDKALADYALALKFDPGYTAAHIAIADIYLRQGKLDQSIKELNAVPKKYESNVDLYIAKGRTYSRLNKMKEAIANFKQAFSLDPKRDAWAYMDAAYCYGVMKDYAAAMSALETAMELQPNTAEFRASHGFYNQLAGNEVRAGEDFERAISMDPKNADAHFWRGGIFERKGDKSAAIQDYEAAVASNPDYAEAKKRLAALNHVERHSSNTPTASMDSIKIIAGDFDTLMKQGYAKMKAKDARGACVCFASAVAVNPSSAQARKYLAYALVMKGNTFDAINQFQALDSAGQADVADQRALASLLVAAERFSDAVGVCLKLVTENPKDTDSRLKLIEAYSRGGDLGKAVEACKEGQKSDPAGSARYLAMLEKLKSSGEMQVKNKGSGVAMPAG